MRVFRYEREKTYGTHNFDAYQVYVAEMSDTKGELHPGILVLHAEQFPAIEVPFPLACEEALILAEFLRNAAGGNLPIRHKVSGSWANFFRSLYFDFRKQGHDSRGNLIIGRILLSGTISRVKVLARSAQDCAVGLELLYNNEKSA